MRDGPGPMDRSTLAEALGVSESDVAAPPSGDGTTPSSPSTGSGTATTTI